MYFLPKDTAGVACQTVVQATLETLDMGGLTESSQQLDKCCQLQLTSEQRGSGSLRVLLPLPRALPLPRERSWKEVSSGSDPVSSKACARSPEATLQNPSLCGAKEAGDQYTGRLRAGARFAVGPVISWTNPVSQSHQAHFTTDNISP